MHPSTSNILQFFNYGHLPNRLQEVSIPFHKLAEDIAYNYEGPEVPACLRKLLEAKDCAVRAALTSTKHETKPGMGAARDESKIRAQIDALNEAPSHKAQAEYKELNKGGRPLSEDQQRDFNSAQAELTRLRQERAVREQNMAVDPQPIREDPQA